MSTVVLMLSQDGITELIQIANDIQGRVDNILGAGQKDKGPPKDRLADAAGQSSFLEVAKEKLPMILEEGDEEGTDVKAISKSKLHSY